MGHFVCCSKISSMNEQAAATFVYWFRITNFSMLKEKQKDFHHQTDFPLKVIAI